MATANDQGSKVVSTYLPLAMVNALEARAQAEDRPGVPGDPKGAPRGAAHRGTLSYGVV